MYLRFIQIQEVGMASGQLQVEYETLEASARSADNLATSFGAQLKTLEQTVKSMVWHGQSGTAFQGYFDTLSTEIAPLQETLHALATAIRGSASRMQQNDQQIATSWNQA
jgi:WXG100 family type VII secretion target